LEISPVGHVVNFVSSSHQIVDALDIGDFDVLLDVGFKASHIVEFQLLRAQTRNFHHKSSNFLIVGSDGVGLAYSLEALSSMFHRVDDGKLGLECCLEGGVGDGVFLPLV
jgi:hypothetical protein